MKSILQDSALCDLRRRLAPSQFLSLSPTFIAPHFCSWLERNDLSGTIPASWANLTSLRRLVIRPGNPILCGPVPPGLPFFLCSDEDVSCLRNQPTLPVCSAAAGPTPEGAAAAGGPADGGAAPSAPAADGSSAASGGGGGGGGVSAAAIAVPVAVGSVLLAALAGGLFVAARRRRRRREQQEEADRKAFEERRVVVSCRIDAAVCCCCSCGCCCCCGAGKLSPQFMCAAQQ